MKKGVIIFIFLTVFSLNFICADFSIGNISDALQKSYGPSEFIKGWINISLDNEPSNSLFEDDEGNSISLIDLINKNSDFVKACSPSNCKTDYEADESGSSKKFCFIEEEEEQELACVSGQKIGDVNGDGNIDSTDSNLVAEIYVGNILMPENICCADVNQDGNVNMIDTILIEQIRIGDRESPGTCTSEEISCTTESVEENSAIFGLKFEGANVNNIADFSLDFASNNKESEALPLSVDILNDGQVEWQAYSASENYGSENFGCFKDVGDTTPKLISVYAQCEKIHLSRTPKAEIGAYIDYVSGEGEVEFDMTIKNSNIGVSKTCTAKTSGTGQDIRISCEPLDFSVDEERDYFVCIKTKKSADNGKYEIASEEEEPCGFTGDSPNPYTFDFEIFARPRKYASDISFTLDDDEAKTSTGKTIDIEGSISSYLNQKYKKDCTNGCVVPIKVMFGTDQEITASNLFVSYSSNEGYTETRDLYSLSESPAKISTPDEKKFQKLFLDKGNFSVPDDFGEYNFVLNLDDDEVLLKKVSVEQVPTIKSLKPRTTAAGYPTEFEAEMDSKANITKYEWNFGDGKNETTFVNKTSHTYTSTGNYTLEITITDNKQKSYSKSFEIEVGSAKDIINKLLQKGKTDLSNIKTQIEDFDLFAKNSIESTLNIDELDSKLTELYAANASATNEEDYGGILTDLLKLEIPELISTSTSAESILFYPNPDNINLEILKEIGGGDYKEGERAKYIESIFNWNQKNIEAEINFRELSAVYEYDEEPLINIFELQITKINETSRTYVILEDLNELNFKEDYSEKSASGYIYIDLAESETISFSTTEDIGIIDLPLFISPSISELSLEKISTEKDEQLSKLALFILILIFLAIIGIIAYIILQEWYKKRYEDYLFKNRNDLYNLVSYIQSAKKNEVKDREIYNQLKQAGWKSEQINYVMKKYAGKRTGMLEIPIGTILNKLKNNENVPPGKSMKKFPDKNFG